jgi:hypothetical protein
MSGAMVTTQENLLRENVARANLAAALDRYGAAAGGEALTMAGHVAERAAELLAVLAALPPRVVISGGGAGRSSNPPAGGGAGGGGYPFSTGC